MALFANLVTNTFVKVEHYTLDSGNANQEGYVADAGLMAVPVNIQPSSQEMLVLNGGAYGKGYTMYTLASGIRESDRLTTVSGTSSTVYTVKGRQNFNYGMAQHLEVYIEETQ